MFITFEGINGSGKSTQARLLADNLQKLGHDVVLTKEPGGGGEFCMKLRKLIVETKDISKLTELFLLYAARNEHIIKLVQPALEAGKIVICDRYVDSSYAYQCCYDWKNAEFVKSLHDKIGGLMPDLTFMMDITVRESEERLAPLIYSSTANEGYKKYDELETEHMQKILDVYHKLADENQDRIVKIDGMQAPEDIEKQILEVVRQRL